MNMSTAADRSRKLSLSYRWPMISDLYAMSVAGTFQKLISEIKPNISCPASQIDCTNDQDKQQMVTWNPQILYSQMNCVHYLVEAVARALPDWEAVCAWNGSLSYAQLDILSSIVAERLIQAGVTVGKYVPFAFEKSLWTVVATLAISKAGGAFVPLEPTHPKARLQEILTSIGADVIVTSDLCATIFKDMVKDIIVVSEHTVELHPLRAARVFHCPDVQPCDPVFVLFTSGSTGKPKGMVHEHGAICTHAIAHGSCSSLLIRLMWRSWTSLPHLYMAVLYVFHQKRIA